MKTTFTYFLKIIIYFTLFLKSVFREQRLKSVKKFLKRFFIFKNKKLFLNHMSKKTLKYFLTSLNIASNLPTILLTQKVIIIKIKIKMF